MCIEMDERMNVINNAAEFIETRLDGRKPEVAVVLGSGLGKLADMIEDPVVIPYSEIPGFPVSTVIGHKGNFVCGQLGGKTVLAMQGRFHYYEGYTMEKLTTPVRVMSRLGIGHIFVSNAAGGLNPEFEIGDIMIIKDHVCLFPNPLIGPNFDEFGPRFPDMTTPYDLGLISQAEKIAAEMGISIHKGVYLGTSGPSYETPAEIRYFRTVGADVVGMSTIPEVIVARHCGMKVFGVSVITNKANTDNVSTVLNDGADVVVQANIAAEKMTTLFSRLIASI